MIIGRQECYNINAMPDVFISDNEKDKKTPSEDTKPKVKEEKKDSRLFGNLLNLEELPDAGRTPLSAFLYRPKSTDFETRDAQEKIILLLRQHPITNVGWIVISTLMFFAPSVLDFFPILSFMPDRFQFVAILGWYLITIAFTLEKFLSWFFNVNIITDERIIDIDFHSLIYKEVTEAKVDNIQDQTFKMGGAVRTIFNYGDVYVQTASEVPNLEFLAVPKPALVIRILQELRTEEEQEKIEGRVR